MINNLKKEFIKILLPICVNCDSLYFMHSLKLMVIWLQFHTKIQSQKMLQEFLLLLLLFVFFLYFFFPEKMLWEFQKLLVASKKEQRAGGMSREFAVRASHSAARKQTASELYASLPVIMQQLYQSRRRKPIGLAFPTKMTPKIFLDPHLIMLKKIREAISHGFKWDFFIL